MSRGLSLHIGLNAVDPARYDGWDGQLAGCENDVASMQQIASSLGYETHQLLTRQATRAAVLDAITKAAATLKKDDIFLLTYSGHGGQINDFSSYEPDGLNETWVLFERQLLDDELYVAWSMFRPECASSCFIVATAGRSPKTCS